MDVWAEYKDFPEWFASGFFGTVQGGNEKEAGGTIHARNPQSITGENGFSARFSSGGTPENLIGLLFCFFCIFNASTNHWMQVGRPYAG
jgi:hypothetical protein